MKSAILIFGLLSFFSNLCLSADFYVSTSGSDSASGTESDPWRTIQHAIDSISAGDTIFVREGTYNEQININKSGISENQRIIIRNYESEKPVIDGNGLEPSKGWSALIKIENQNYITVRGFEVKNFASSDQESVPIGILVCGSGSHISLLGNLVHHIEHKNVSSVDGNAHGIAVYGTNGNSSINNLVISDNIVKDCKLGWSESLVLNGNVENFVVSGNIVHDNDNIGMDFIGWENTASSNDQARNGIVTGNTVYKISSFSNPAYGGERSAGGIYVDGGKDIIIERNCVYECDLGIEVASENKDKTTSGINVRNNILFFNNVTGLAFGGYDTKRGTTVNCVFMHNTFYMNDTTNSGTGEIMIQKSNSNVVANNIVFANSQNIILSNYFTSAYSYNNIFDYNLYYCLDGSDKSLFIWQNKEYQGFESFKDASLQDANSLFADPLFIDAASNPPVLDISANSPAINAGSPDFIPGKGETDYAGNPRIVGGRTDCGAYEFQGGSGQTAELVLAVSPDNAGETQPSAGKHIIEVNVPITISATSSKGYIFLTWTVSGNAALKDALSATTILLLTGDAIVTANFAVAPPSNLLAPGSIISITAENIFPGQKFTQKPRVFGTVDGTDCRMPIIEKPSKSNPIDKINAVWKRKILIYDKWKYNKKALLSDLLKTPIPDKQIERILVKYLGEEKKYDGEYCLATPIISSISRKAINSGNAFKITGKYFGSKLPNIYVEYLKNGDKNRPGYKKCKLDKTASYKYQDAYHKNASSCMVVYSDDPSAEGKEIGYSELIATYPKLKESEILTGYIILDNGISLASFPLSILDLFRD